MAEVSANLATTTLNANLSSGGLSVAVGSDAAFPSTGNFRIRIGNELIVVTDVSGSNVLGGLQRGAEGTTASAHALGDPVRHVLTRDSLNTLIAEGAGGLNVILATLSAMSQTHADTYVAATAHGLALLLDPDAAATKQALGLELVNNTADSTKIVSGPQATADSKRTPVISVGATGPDRPVAGTDMGGSITHTGSDGTRPTTGWISTLNPGLQWQGAAVLAGQNFEIRRTTSGAATFAWASGITIEDSATGASIAGPSQIQLDRYATLRVTKRSTGTPTPEFWTLEWRSRASADVAVLKEAPLLPEYFGGDQNPAVVADNATAINAAFRAAEGVGGEVYTKPGLGYQVKTSVRQGPRSTLRLGSDIYVDPANSTTLTQVVQVEDTGTQIFGARILGDGGNIRCNRKANDGIRGNVMRGSRFRDFEIMDPIQYGFRILNSHASLDSDSCTFEDLYIHADNNGAFIGTDLRPLGAFWFDNSGARIISDMLVDNCQIVGLSEETGVAPGGAGDGGWGVTIDDAQRIKIRDFMCADAVRRYSGGVRIRSTAGSIRDAQRNVIERLYLEAGVNPGTFTSWRNVAIRLQCMSTSAKAVAWTEISGLGANWFGSDNHGVRLELLATSTAGGNGVRDNTYRSPRGNNLASAGQIIASGSGSLVNNYVEVSRDTEAAFVTGFTGTNRIFKLSGTTPGFV